MKELAKKGLFLGLGLLVMSKEQVERAVDELVQKGKISAAESRNMVNRLIETGEREREQMDQALRERLIKVLSELDIPTRKGLGSVGGAGSSPGGRKGRKAVKASDEAENDLKENVA